MSKVLRLSFVLVVALVVGLTLLWTQTGQSQAEDPPPLDITADGKLILTYSSGANVKLVFVEAGYNNDFGIASPVDQHIFYCNDVPPGYTVDLGTFSPGELMFKLTSPDPYTYYTGPADRNPDNVVHALIDRLSPTSAQIQWEDLYGGGDFDYNDCVVDLVVEPIEADLKIVSQEILAANCVDLAPTDIDVSSDVDICVKKILHNNGPVSPVDVDIAKTASAPAGCTIVPTADSDQVVLDISVDVEHTEIFTIHCSEPSTHGPFVIENTIAPKDPDILDLQPGNNSATSQLTVDAWAYADVKILSQEFIDPPAEIDVSGNVVVHLRKEVHNNGSAPVTFNINAVATPPPGCTIDPLLLDYQQWTLGPSEDVILDEPFTIHCSEPSFHTFTVTNTVSAPKEPHVIDPDMGNNSWVTDLTVPAIAQADAKIIEQWIEGCEDLNGNTICELGEPSLPAPLEIPVSEDVPIMVKKTIHNNGTYGPVNLETVKTAVASADCEVTPGLHVEQIHDVPVSVSVTHNEPFTVHCSEPSEHTFTFDNVISIKDPHVTDPNGGNNTAHTDWIVPAIAQADLKIVDQRIVDWPSDVDVSENRVVTLETDVHNNGPYGLVEAEFEGWLTPPSECTIVSGPISQQVVLDAGETQTIQQQFTIHCGERCLRTFTFHNRITAKEPHIHDPEPANNEDSRVLPSVHSWAQADVKIVSQGFLSPPAEILVSEDVVVTLEKVLHNNGPYAGAVTVTINKTATAPADCSISPLGHSEDVVLPESVDVTVNEDFTIHCSEGGTYTFSVDNIVGAPKEVHVADPDDTNNVESTDLTVEAIGEADVKIISQQFIDPPSEIAVSEQVLVTLEKIVHNNGPYGPVYVDITKTATAPPGCTIDPEIYTYPQVELPVSVDMVLIEDFLIHCSEPSEHTFTVVNEVSGPKEPLVTDPNMGNNIWVTELTVAAIAEADVKVTSVQVSGPAEIEVSQDVNITVSTTFHNNGLYGPVEVSGSYGAPGVPADCNVATVDPPQYVLPVSVDVVDDHTWTIHCDEPSEHTFTFATDILTIKDPHVVDPDPDNNSNSGDYTVVAIAEADVKVTSVQVSGPAEIEVSQDVDITVSTTFHNNGLYGPVEVSGSYGAPGVPADCNVATVDPPQYVLPVSVDVVDDHTWTIHCDEPSEHTFTFATDILTIKDPHVVDPDPDNNSNSGDYTVLAIAYADMKVADQYVEDPPTEISPSEDVPVVLDKIIHNNGPWEPVDVLTETVVTAPPGCTVYPEVHAQQFHNVPVSADILHHEPFTIHCSELGQFTFIFDDTVEHKDPHVWDPDPDNNSATTELTVNSVSEADVKIVSASFVDPPTKVDLGVDVDVTLEKVLHNNGPWEPVDIAIDATATAPTGCTVVENSVPDLVSDVPVSVDQVVTEVWTVNCTETGLKTFVFDNTIDVATPYVSDPDPGNNTSHKLLTVMDDASAEDDADGDGLFDAFDPCPVDPDCDDDGVSDGPINPDGDGPIVAGPDNCPLVANPDQADFDGDGVGDACDTDDADADGFLDGVELHVGTDPLDACPDDPSDDAWPLDNNIDSTVTVVGDVLSFGGHIGAAPGDSEWNQRLDLNADGVITIVGDMLLYGGRIGESCT